MILVTKRRQIGCICGHAIYSIDESQLITIPHVSIQSDVAHSKTELRYFHPYDCYFMLNLEYRDLEQLSLLFLSISFKVKKKSSSSIGDTNNLIMLVIYRTQLLKI